MSKCKQYFWQLGMDRDICEFLLKRLWLRGQPLQGRPLLLSLCGGLAVLAPPHLSFLLCKMGLTTVPRVRSYCGLKEMIHIHYLSYSMAQRKCSVRLVAVSDTFYLLPHFKENLRIELNSGTELEDNSILYYND